MSIPDRASDYAGVLQGLRILIVEDELLVALETQAVVQGFGGIVVGPYSRVPIALRALESHPVDGAILDINVAGIQSLAIAEMLRQRNVPFIFCTGYDRDSVPLRYREVPMVDKPLLRERVVAALLQAIAANAAQTSS